MPSFPLQIVTSDESPLSFNQRYKSSPLNKKFAGTPKGVYVGFEPSVAPPSPILTLSTDSTEGYSIIKLPSQADVGGLDVIADSAITIDFTGETDFPYSVIARASYSDDEDTPTTAEIITRNGGSVADDEVLICVVDGTASSLTVVSNPALGQRDDPLARIGRKFGFMPAGSIEDLEAATDIVNEVVTARTGLDGTVHDSLSERLAADQTAESMADRLSLAFVSLRSNEYSVSAGVTEVNVAGSFTEVDRSDKPLVTLGGLGAETTEGAVAAPNDEDRNLAVVQDSLTGNRAIDGPVNRRIVFGRIEGPEELPIAGTWTFTNASTTVSGTGGTATGDLAVGDTIQGVDGLFYEIASIPSNNSIVLSSAYRGTTSTSGGLNGRRWLLKLRRINATAEENASFSVPTTIRFYFGAFIPLAQGNMDWSLAMHSPSEKPLLPDATTTEEGKVTLATAGAKLGGVFIENGGATLSGGPFHTLNFNASSASVIVGPSGPGEVEVVEIGDTGPIGPPGTSGGPGPTGPTGPGYSLLNPFEISGEFDSSPGSTVPFSFTAPMGHNVRYVAGGIAQYRDDAFFTIPDTIDILDISASGTDATISGTLGGPGATSVHHVTLFLSSAGD